jgi:hypothetical protein
MFSTLKVKTRSKFVLREPNETFPENSMFSTSKVGGYSTEFTPIASKIIELKLHSKKP